MSVVENHRHFFRVYSLAEKGEWEVKVYSLVVGCFKYTTPSSTSSEFCSVSDFADTDYSELELWVFGHLHVKTDTPSSSLHMLSNRYLYTPSYKSQPALHCSGLLPALRREDTQVRGKFRRATLRTCSM